MECIFLKHDKVVGAIGAMLGVELQYEEEQDIVGKRIENIVHDLENISESDYDKPNQCMFEYQ